MSLAENLSPNPREQIGGNLPPATVAEEMQREHADLLNRVDVMETKRDRLPTKISTDDEDAQLADVGADVQALARKIEDARKGETGPLYTRQKEINGFFAVFADRLDAVLEDLTARATDYKKAKAATERRRLEEQARREREEADRQRAISDAAAAAGKDGKALRHEDRAAEADDRAFRAGHAAQASSADLARVRSTSGAMSTMKGTWSFTIEDISKVPLDVLRPYFTSEAIEKALRAHVKTYKDTVQIPGVRIFKDEKASFRR